MVPWGSSEINSTISVVRENGSWTYYCGLQAVFHHPEEDQASYRLFTSNLVALGACRQSEILRTFGTSKNSVLRGQKKLRDEGASGFYQVKPRGGPTVITATAKVRAVQLFKLSWTSREVAKELGIKHGTLIKAIAQKRIDLPKEVSRSLVEAEPDKEEPTDKSTRGDRDAEAEIGMACTRPLERVLAAFGQKEGAATNFEDCRDVTFGGVLAAIPALTANGLFRHLECLSHLKGYYTRLQIILVLAYMALCRIKTVEQLQYHSPGELGKLMGLDRVPEVRCLRHKLDQLTEDDGPENWAARLSADWMEAAPELAGRLYVDGHVRLYHGKKTKLPPRFVSRQRLCLRGTSAYYVNDAIGQPFFAWNALSTRECWRR